MNFFTELDEHEERETIVCENVTDGLKHIRGEQFLNIIHLNIRSLNKNFDELLVYIESLENNVDIIVLSETWKLEGLCNFSIPNFNIFYNESFFNKNDGVVVYVKHNIDPIFNIIHLSETKLLRFLFVINNTSYALTASYLRPM